jgi:hypothetical protein
MSAISAISTGPNPLSETAVSPIRTPLVINGLSGSFGIRVFVYCYSY